MNILLAFAPFLLFVVVERLVGVPAGLAAGAIAALVLVIRDLIEGRAIKLLETGTVLLFGGLALYALSGAGAAWSIAQVRLYVDAGLLAIVLVSLAIRRPFTLQYARESVERALWDRPGFVRTNYVITAVWAVAFAAMVVADLMLVYLPALRPAVAIIVTVAALWGAVRFTRWYPSHMAARA